MRRNSATRRIPIVILILAPLAVLFAAGAIPLDELTVAAAHHVFYIVIPVVAFAVFALYAANDIRKHGWPTFSWRLNPALGDSR